MSRSIFALRAIGLSFAVAAFGLTVATPTRADEIKLPADGWASWETPATDGAPFWCCWSSWEKLGEERRLARNLQAG